MVKRLLVATAFVIAASSVFAIEISEAMLNGYVKQALAERANRDIQILNRRPCKIHPKARVQRYVGATALICRRSEKRTDNNASHSGRKKMAVRPRRTMARSNQRRL